MRLLLTSVRVSLVFMLLCGLIYNLAVTTIAQAIMPYQANGSLIRHSTGGIIGSELIGQSFSESYFFQGRVSSIRYDASGSGTPNYAPSNPELLKRVQESIASWKINNPSISVSEVPIDLITNSGSGLDPHISPEAAVAQIARISSATGLDQEKLKILVREHTESRALGFLGEPTVNVLKLNIALQSMLSQ